MVQPGRRMGQMGILAGAALIAWACARSGTAADSTLAFDPELRQIVLTQVAESRERIDAELYLLSDRGVLAALGAAVRRGVAVRVLLCPSQDANNAAAARLRRAGAEVRWYPLAHPDQIMHLKLALCDRQRLLFGSVNWTHTGLTLNHEGLLLIAEPGVISRAAEQFDADWERSTSVHPVVPASGRKRE